MPIIRRFQAVIAITVTAILFSTSTITAGEDWKLVKNDSEIKVYTRPIAGSDMDEFKGIGIIDARLDVVIAALNDIPAQKEWVVACREAHILKTINDESMLVYSRAYAPWPVSDRDVIVKRTLKANFESGMVTIYMSALKDPIVPLQRGAVRITEMEGRFILEHLDRNRTKISYILRTNPAGYIPDAIANYASKDMPYRTIVALRKVVTQDKYIQAAGKSDVRTKLDAGIKSGHLKQ
jgi:hypothetical protein